MIQVWSACLVVPRVRCQGSHVSARVVQRLSKVPRGRKVHDVSPRLVRAPPAGDQPENWRVAGPRTGGHQPKCWTGAVLSFNLDSDGCLFEVPGTARPLALCVCGSVSLRLCHSPYLWKLLVELEQLHELAGNVYVIVTGEEFKVVSRSVGPRPFARLLPLLDLGQQYGSFAIIAARSTIQSLLALFVLGLVALRVARICSQTGSRFRRQLWLNSPYQSLSMQSSPLPRCARQVAHVLQKTILAVGPAQPCSSCSRAHSTCGTKL